MKEQKNIMIMGDSYSTYKGYIPEGYNTYYSDEREAAPVVKGVEKTWWRLVADENNMNVVLNDSFSGSMISNSPREKYPIETSFISRIDKYISENFFVENKINTMFIFGGTNDSWFDAAIGKLKYSDWTADELKCVLPAFCYLLSRAKTVVDKIIVIINDGLKQEIVEGFVQACEKNNVTYLCLDGIDKESGHPTELGMKQISQQLAKCLD